MFKIQDLKKCGFFLLFLLFLYMVIVKTENRSSNNIQITSPKSHKAQIKILTFPGLALSGSEHPGATLLGWPKSIYYPLKETQFGQALMGPL